MKKAHWLAGVSVLAAALFVGCQKKEVPTTETQKTTEASSPATTPDANATTTHTETTTTTSSPAPTPTP